MTRNPFAVPEHALPAWERLHEQITRAGATPCADPSVRDHWTGTAGEQHYAADACLDCPVMSACAAYCDAAGETAGVWGGLTARQRTDRQKGAA